MRTLGVVHGSYHQLILLFALLCASCAHTRESATKAGVSAPLKSSVSVTRSISIGVYYGPEMVKNGLNPEFIHTFIDGASRNLARNAGLGLHLTDLKPLAPGRDDSRALTERLTVMMEDISSQPEVVLILTRKNDEPKTAARASKSEFLRRVIVLGVGPKTLFEKSPQGFAIRSQSQLLLGLGRIFGALPSCLSTVMSPTRRAVPYRPLVWLAANLEIIKTNGALDLRTVNGDPTRLPSEILQKNSALLEKVPKGLECQEQRGVSRRLALLAAAQQKQALNDKNNRAARTRDYDLEAALGALASDDYAAALARCGALVEEDPDLPGASRCAGESSEALGLPNDAIFYYRVHLASWPDDVEILVNLARLLGRRGDDSAALSLLQHAVVISPESVTPLLNLGIALARVDRLEDAHNAWREVLRLAPNNADALELLKASGGAVGR